MFGLGTREIVVIAIVVILLFGSKKIPELAKSLAEAVRHISGIFKSADESKEIKK